MLEGYHAVRDLPSRTFIAGSVIRFCIFDATGRKYKKRSVLNGHTETTDYIGTFQYQNGVLDFMHTAKGRLVKDGSDYHYEYFLKDHLGNTRAVLGTEVYTESQATLSPGSEITVISTATDKVVLGKPDDWTSSSSGMEEYFDYFWQTTADGTSWGEGFMESPYELTTCGTWYLRMRRRIFVVGQLQSEEWTDHGSVQVTVADACGSNAIRQQDDYYPFGLSFNSYVSGTENDYKFNGKEEQDEWGVYDYGARYFDPAIARFISIDPASDNYQSWTPYHYVMNNPIKFVDPTGMFTELFNENGKKIGEDENGADGNVAVVTDKKEVKRVKENTKNGTHTESSSLNSTVNLPSATVREAMGIAVDNSNAPNESVGDSKGGFHEEGGIFGTTNGEEKVIAAQPGQSADPSVDSKAEVDVFSGETPDNYLENVDGTYHVHPSGTVTNGNATSSFVQSPSDQDISNAASSGRSGNNYVLGAGDGKVYIYNGGGVKATFPLKQFRTIGVKKK